LKNTAVAAKRARPSAMELVLTSMYGQNFFS
jgi:hypothetical protein